MMVVLTPTELTRESNKNSTFEMMHPQLDPLHSERDLDKFW